MTEVLFSTDAYLKTCKATVVEVYDQGVVLIAPSSTPAVAGSPGTRA
jgi:Ser-tRNA(Ala) deacylase AlaX